MIDKRKHFVVCATIKQNRRGRWYGTGAGCYNLCDKHYEQIVGWTGKLKFTFRKVKLWRCYVYPMRVKPLGVLQLYEKRKWIYLKSLNLLQEMAPEMKDFAEWVGDNKFVLDVERMD